MIRNKCIILCKSKVDTINNLTGVRIKRCSICSIIPDENSNQIVTLVYQKMTYRFMDLIGDLKCINCKTTLTPPTHCGRNMSVQDVDGKNTWVCWKGVHEPCCGRDSFENYKECCDEPQLEGHLVKAFNVD